MMTTAFLPADEILNDRNIRRHQSCVHQGQTVSQSEKCAALSAFRSGDEMNERGK
jgi:hypothetical protein